MKNQREINKAAKQLVENVLKEATSGKQEQVACIYPENDSAEEMEAFLKANAGKQLFAVVQHVEGEPDNEYFAAGPSADAIKASLAAEYAEMSGLTPKEVAEDSQWEVTPTTAKVVRAAFAE